ncbi:MAG: Rpn family recombination-promoting nuclease/putative transposase [Prevotella pectinovora]|uniref:Rpn family recombination-promoting nuclease/putative transposase n=1 Tax=Prevotella pectinovora TaxID=1602169 RepID=UPI002A80F283|nr:Rpn family recombination-promoting nuclease/putative transposase [Prevotella pectinovora]MDY4778211.1 Rpn family recombination-promoting nuclease/putative transposase [Prevotella pectinovora]
MAKFINPFTDIGFKRIFGQEISKPLIIDFLNSLLLGEERITNITFLDKEQPALFEDDRSLIYDIYCQTEKGENIIVEMQNKSQPYFKNRSIYYVCEAIARQGERGTDWKYNIDAVYLVAFLNFCPMDFDKKFRSDIGLADKGNNKLFSDKMRMTFMQLPLFTKEADECDTDFDKWIYVLKNMETLTRLPWAAKSSVFKRLEQIADVASLSRQERMKYDVGLRKYRDTLSVLEGAKQDGLAEGRAEGIEKEKIETVKRLKAIGADINMITVATGLSAEEATRILSTL